MESLYILYVTVLRKRGLLVGFAVYIRYFYHNIIYIREFEHIHMFCT